MGEERDSYITVEEVRAAREVLRAMREDVWSDYEDYERLG